MKVRELEGRVEYIRKQIICYIIFLLMIFTTSYSIGKYHSLFTRYATLQLNLQSQVDITKSLEEYKENLLAINADLADKYNTEILNGINKPFAYIESLKEYNKESYMYAYLSICDMIEDPPEMPQDVMSAEEYDMFCRIVEAEIGNGSFDQKCHVSSAIVNRYYGSTFPNDWMELFTQDNQFSTYSNGSYKRMEVSQSTELSIAYSLMIEDTAQGCEFFRSGDKEMWHDKSDNVEFVFSDEKHKLYKLKEK